MAELKAETHEPMYMRDWLETLDKFSRDFGMGDAGRVRMTKDLSGLDVDGVWCISLKQREDRRAALLESFRHTGLDIEFFLVDKDEEDPQRGCYESHRACARTALERQYKRTLILEDDCVITSFSSRTVPRINRFLRANDPEIFYLGVLPGKIWLTWRPGISRCRGQGAHAYLISARGCRKMLDWENYAGKGIDNFFSKRFKGYCVFPMICFQNDLASDIQAYRQSVDNSHPQRAMDFSRKQYISALKNIHKTLLFR
jgi:glycosyl transferase family 25